MCWHREEAILINVFPDAKIYSTVADGAVGYGYKVGTSMATPHVAGVAAMIFWHRPDLYGKGSKGHYQKYCDR
mgnify:CR=1 FL=1